jgi:hypothetical protein
MTATTPYSVPSRSPIQGICFRPANHEITAPTSRGLVSPGASAQAVPAPTSPEVVVSTVPTETIVFASAPDGVTTTKTHDDITVWGANQRVLPGRPDVSRGRAEAIRLGPGAQRRPKKNRWRRHRDQH